MRVIASHPCLTMGPMEIEDRLDAIGSGKRDEFGVKLLNVYFNERGRAFCVSDAPNTEAVRKSHEKLGVWCDEVAQVDCLGC